MHLAFKKRRRFWPFLLVLLVLAVLIGSAFWQRLTISRFTVSSAKLPEAFDGFRIVQITDLHCTSFGEQQEQLCRKIESLEPDLIVLTGDMNDQHRLDLEPTRALCAAFSGRVPMYAVTGNHDLWVSSSEFQKLRALYEEYGVVLLRGDTVALSQGDAVIYLHGEDDPAHWGNNTVGYLSEHPLSVTPEPGAFNILLYHRANAFPVTSTLGFDLVISGHMHGGQVRLPFVGGLVSPTQEFLPDYTAGMYQENGTTMIVGRGLGNAVSIPRIWNPPEIVCITLKRSAE